MLVALMVAACMLVARLHVGCPLAFVALNAISFKLLPRILLVFTDRRWPTKREKQQWE